MKEMSMNRATKPGLRQADYSNIGYAGRKTGVVLKQTTARDEYGMPDIDDLFSSPQRPTYPNKAPLRSNGISRSTAVEDTVPTTNLQLDEQSYSSPRRLIPPKSRSPIKTSIGSPRKSLNGSPTKTMALLASPVRMGPRIQGRVADAEETKGDAFASSKHKRRSLEQAPKRPRASISNPNPMNSHLQLPRRSVFEISSSPAVRQATSNHLNGKGIVGSSPQRLQKTPPQVNKVGKRIHDSAVGKVVSPHVNGQHIKESSEAPLFVTQNHRSSLPPSDEPELPGRSPLQSARLKSSGKAKGKRRLDDIEAEERTKKSLPVTQLEDVEEEMEEDFEPIAEGFNDYDVADEVYEEVYDDGDVEPTIDEVPESELEPVSISHPNRSLQLPKSNKQATQSRPPERPLKRHSPSEEDSQVESSQPTKKPRLSPVRTMLPPANPPPKASPAKRPKDRDANIKTMFGKAKSKQSAPPPQTIPSRSPPLSKSRPKGRGLQIMKDDAEPEIDGARYTRSGRTSVKPVEYWRGERIIYTEPRREGGRVSLPGIKEVIRVDEGPIPSRSKSKRKTARSQKRQVSVESEIDEIEQEWELEPGVFAGEVPSWDSIEQRGDPEYPEQVDLAIAPRGLELLTKEVKGATFQYAKTITLPFFHSGMVDLPPGGEKKTKNSRRNHMVFWVFSGRVIADVSGNEFSLGRGGMWQVPRGNTYSVSNPHDKPARIFFAQGSYMTAEEGEAFEEGDAPNVAAAVQE